jgi:riboflavin biosynthesis pyrimidine reductase
VFSEGGPIVAEALTLAGLADVVIVSTADHRLGEAGLPAQRKGLKSALEDGALYRRIGEQRHGTDVFTTFERTD